MDHTNKNILGTYIKAIQNKNHFEAIEILTKSIKDIASDDKENLIVFLIDRIKGYFKIQNYREVLNDCSKLVALGYDIDNDSVILSIQAYRCPLRLKISRDGRKNKLPPPRQWRGSAAMDISASDSVVSNHPISNQKPLKLMMTNPNDSNNLVAIKIGQLYISCNQHMKNELQKGIDSIKELEREKDLQDLKELKQILMEQEEYNHPITSPVSNETIINDTITVNYSNSIPLELSKNNLYVNTTSALTIDVHVDQTQITNNVLTIPRSKNPSRIPPEPEHSGSVRIRSRETSSWVDIQQILHELELLKQKYTELEQDLVKLTK
ncbi:hypothetical protein I4U23_031232 [Adineta vaga]|nr:hypothetical protein I4U23_031232 [Adineta vaga]